MKYQYEDQTDHCVSLLPSDETLVLQEAVLKMERPQSRTVEAVQTWLNAPNGRHAPSFSGLAAKRLDDESDLVALHPPFEKDWLSRLVDIPYLRFFCLVSISFQALKYERMFTPVLGFSYR